MNNNKYKILFVEDELNIQTFVKVLLEANGYRVITAQNCAMATALYSSHVPDLVILDLGLPDKDGSVFLQDVRANDMTPVIVLSARGEEYDKINGFEIGIDDYVVKPFSPKELLLRINAILKRTASDKVEEKKNERIICYRKE